MIPGRGEAPRPKDQILEILYICENSRYFSRLRRSTKPNPTNNAMFHYFAPQGAKFLELNGYNVNFFDFTIFSIRSVLIYLCFTIESLFYL